MKILLPLPAVGRCQSILDWLLTSPRPPLTPEMRAHLDDCPTCAMRVQTAATLIVHSPEPTIPAGLRARMLAPVAVPVPVPPAERVIPYSHPKSGFSTHALMPMLAAAALLFLFLGSYASLPFFEQPVISRLADSLSSPVLAAESTHITVPMTICAESTRSIRDSVVNPGLHAPRHEGSDSSDSGLDQAEDTLVQDLSRDQDTNTLASCSIYFEQPKTALLIHSTAYDPLPLGRSATAMVPEPLLG